MGVIDSLKGLLGVDSGRPYEAPTGIPAPDQPRKLVLYKFDACPWCRIVQRVIDANDIPVSFEDTSKDPGARARLRERTGRTQVPCLFIDDTPFFESRDIKKWLLAYVDGGHHRPGA